MNNLKCLFICLLIFSCSDSDSESNLTSYVKTKKIETGAVISCAASDNTKANTVLVFFYPELGATNIRLYQTTGTGVDKDNFKNYEQVFAESQPVFKGYLRHFTQETTVERWYIVSFELDNEIKISNPVRSKQITKPTVWKDIVTVNQEESGMPLFEWQDNATGDNAIYFQVVTDANNNLLSGTYTNHARFQYYKLDNVVLNVTRNTPPALISDTTYRFTLMDVSLDNWVNGVTADKTFVNK